MRKEIEQREWLKSTFSLVDEVPSDQELKLPQPPLEKPEEAGTVWIELPKLSSSDFDVVNPYELITDRVSHRSFKDREMSLKDLSFLLWSTQGVKEVRGNQYAALRTVPSAGARHPFETYLVVHHVESLKSGVYRYSGLRHSITCVFEDSDTIVKAIDYAGGQKFAGNCNVLFVWAALPYRGEWRYKTRSHKAMLLDAGHVCQNLYIACQAIHMGTCAIAAYNQEQFDQYLKLDGVDEFTLYMSPVGYTK